jgi:hypothetical protein
MPRARVRNLRCSMDGWQTANGPNKRGRHGIRRLTFDGPRYRTVQCSGSKIGEMGLEKAKDLCQDQPRASTRKTGG